MRRYRRMFRFKLNLETGARIVYSFSTLASLVVESYDRQHTLYRFKRASSYVFVVGASDVTGERY